MGLEARGSRLYFYEKKRVGRRVFSKYIGGGLVAAMAAEASATARQERDQQRREQRRIRDEQKQIERQLDEQGSIVAETTGQFLRLAGFHQHKGQWRKKRIGNEAKKQTGTLR
jgi:glycine/serine hydroxymethyltransferase